MVPSPQTRHGDRKLSEVAKHLILPEGIVSTGWPAVRDRCGEWGVVFDRWQDGMGRVILSKRDSGLFAAGVGGVGMSIPRQTGKTFTVGMIILGLCSLSEELTVLWTSHHSKTTTKTFESLQGMAQRKKVAPLIRQVRTGNGDQQIIFTNGSRIYFGAREQGFGRGFDDVDIEIFDEAQILSEQALSDMVPAANVSTNPLIIFMGTPPRPSDPSEAFANRRAEALAGDAPDAAWIEFGADEHADPTSRAQWRKANPSFPHRTSETSILRMMKMLGPESFKREGLGIWDETASARAIPAEGWRVLTVKEPPADAIQSFGIKFAIDGSAVALAGALKPKDGPIYVEGIEQRSASDGIEWLADYLVPLWRDAAQIVIDGKSGAGALVDALRRAGVAAKVILTPSVADVITAHSLTLEAIKTGGLSHLADPELDRQVRIATKRKIGAAGGFGWQAPEGDTVALLDAITLAHWAALTSKRHPGRKAVALA